MSEATYKKRSENSDLWQRKAEEIARAVQDLWSIKEPPEREGFVFVQHHKTCLFLMGVCLETYLKGLLLKQKIQFKFNHDLPDFAQKSNLNLTEEEKYFLKCRKVDLLFGGKYPVAKNLKDYCALMDSTVTLEKDGRKFSKYHSHSLREWDIFEDIFNKIAEGFKK